MEFPNQYKVLDKNSFEKNEFSILPIRYQDRYKIMEWRNEQMYHLRQDALLTKTDQDSYFKNVVAPLFDQVRPDQILFSYLKNGECIGYGGLVHIKWKDRHAEISFIMKTELEANGFDEHWSIFLDLLEKVAFEELGLYKIHSYAFDLRPAIYRVLENAKFEREAVLREHCFFEGDFIDVVIHSKFNRS